MVYFQTHWSGQAQDTHATFGLRLDRNAAVEDGVIEYQRLLQRPAALDFRIGSEGVQTFTIAGVDYAQWYRVHRADEAGGSAEAAPEATDSGEAAPETVDAEGAAKAEQTAAGVEPAPEAAKTTISGILNKAPVGVIIGVSIGIFLVSGLGG